MTNINRSYPEIVVANFIKQYYSDALFSYKGFPWNTGEKGGLSEIDIYIPSLQFGIEYDGQMYHDEDKLSYDLRKNMLCEQHNIHLLRIREELCPPISGDVIKTTNDYTIQSFSDLIENLRIYLNSNFHSEIFYTSTSEIYKIMLDAKEENMNNKKLVETFADEAKEYLTYYNTNIIPTNAKYEKNGEIISVGSHLSKIRTAYKNGELTDKQISNIAKTYPYCFMTQKEINNAIFENNWDEMLKKYSLFYEDYNVRHKISENTEFQKLVSWKKSVLNRMANNSLDEEKIKQLLKVDPSFSESANKISFDKKLNLYKAFIKEHGTSEVTIKTTYKNFNLGEWVLNQRASYKQDFENFEKGNPIDELTKYKIKELTRLVSEDFFVPHNEARWLSNFDDYKSYLFGKEFTDENAMFKALVDDCTRSWTVTF